MVKKIVTLFVIVLCLGLFVAGCAKKKVVVNRDRSSVQRSEEAERAAREAREAQEAKEKELARIKEEEARLARKGEFEKSLVAKKESGIEGEVFETKLLKDVYFEFDKYEIRPKDEEVLKGNAGWL